MILIEKLKSHLQNRSGKVLFNIICSMFAKGGALLISFFLVPLTIDYLSPAEYGVWMTLSSIVAWVTYFDVGLGNGLRNKLTEALSLNDLKLAREYVSTCYFFILLIGIVFVAGLWIANHFLSWNRILNIAEGMIPGCNQFAFLIFAFFTFTFVLRTTGVVFTAYQYPMISDIIQFVINLLIASGIIILKYMQPHGSIKPVGYVYILVPFVIWLLVYPLTFWGKLRAVRPTFLCFNKQHLGSLMVLGGKFFAIQIVCIVFFSSINIIIAHLCGSEAVTQYNIVFKYFSLLTFISMIILTPYWSAMTDAFFRKDYVWIKKQMKKLVAVWGIGIGINLLMLLFSPVFYKIWVGTKIHIPFSLSIAMCCYVGILLWTNIFATFMNGIGKLILQMISLLTGGIVFFLVYYIFSFWKRTAGIVWGLNIALLILAIILPLQYYMLIYQQKKGIWDR